MIQFFSTDDDSGVAKITTIDAFRAALANPVLQVYAVVGGAADPAWTVARTARAALPALEIYLFSDLNDLRQWVPNDAPVGIAFGFGNQPKILLEARQAADPLVAIALIAQASQ
jgi:hypothetical protein